MSIHLRWRYAQLLPYIQQEWRRVSIILGLTALTGVIAAVQPWSMKILVDYGLKAGPPPEWVTKASQIVGLGHGPRSFVWLAGLASLMLFIANTAVTTALNWSWSVAGRRMTGALSRDLFSRLQRRSILVHHKSRVGDSISRVATDAWSVMDFTNLLVISPSTNLLSLVVVGTVGWTLNRQMAAMTLVLAPLLVGSTWVFGKRMKHRALASRDAHVRIVSFVQQTLSAIPVVQAFGREDLNRRRFSRMAEEATGMYQREVIVGGWYGIVNGLITTIGMGVVLYVGGRRALAGELTIGALLVFMSYLSNLQSVSQGLLGLYTNLKPVQAKLDRVLDILEAADAIPAPRAARTLASNGSRSSRSVVLDRVTFGYEPGRVAIEDVTIEARPGQTIAIVGETGAGKSTVAGLIPRFYDPWQGRVTIDGTDLRDLDLASVRQQTAVVLQEPFILPMSIADNVAYGRVDSPSRDRIAAAARAANAESFIERLPAGYDTVVGERGATLSGGEKQRLAIARALLKDAPILILDEPTSSLDALTEASLLEALKRLMAGRTTFLIGHRLSTLRHADEIVVFQRGRIVERGTHDALVRAGGVYLRHFARQLPDRSLEVSA